MHTVRLFILFSLVLFAAYSEHQARELIRASNTYRIELIKNNTNAEAAKNHYYFQVKQCDKHSQALHLTFTDSARYCICGKRKVDEQTLNSLSLRNNFNLK